MKIAASFLLLFLAYVSFPDDISHFNRLSGTSDSSAVCIVSGEALGEDVVKYKYLNKELTFCCTGCEKKFKKEPAAYLKDALRCPVCDEDDAKKDLSAEAGGVKYYFCGDGCKRKFETDPDMFLNHYHK